MAQTPAAVPRLLHIAAVPTAVFLVFAVWWLAGWGGQSTMRVLIVVGGVGFPAFAAVSTGLAARRARGRQRRAWAYMTVGLAAWTFSEVVTVYHRVWLGSVHPLYPSAANVGFLLFPVAACVAMLVLPAGYPGGNWFPDSLGRRNRRRSILRRVVGGGAAPGVRRGRGEKLRRVSCRWPIRSSEVVTVTVAVLVLARAHARWRVTVTLLTVGLTLIAAVRRRLRVPVCA